MPRGIDPAPTSSVNNADPPSKRGIATTPPNDRVFGPGPLGRGVTVTTSEPGGSLPR
jgi:hypothetical protein